MEDRKIYFNRVIKKAELGLVTELKEDMCTFSFIRSNINEALGFPESFHEQTKKQKQIIFEATLDFIHYLLKYKDCSVSHISPDGSAFIEWHLSPEEAVEKVQAMWLMNGDSYDPVNEPWFMIKEEPKKSGT